MKRKSIYFTSDWHIGHNSILKFCNRPFKDCAHMHQVLINNYNAIVPEDGICYFVGDMGLCRSEVMEEVISQLNGIKVLILGNHDKGMEAMYKLGFDVVVYGVTLQICRQRVTITHCPLLDVYRENTTGMRGSDGTENWHREKDHIRFSTNDCNQYHLHGHIHSPNGGKSKKILGKQYDVGVDANNYRPINISKIESWIATYKEDGKK